MERILIVDDEKKVCELLGIFLKKKGFTVYQANDGEEALEKVAAVEPDIVLLDIRMPKMDGVECLRQIKEGFPDTEVIMVTATGELSTAISCMQNGAFGYQEKPVKLDALYMDVKRAFEHRRLVHENRDYQQNLEQKVEERTAEILQLHGKLKESFIKSLRMMVGIIELYDAFLGGHSKRVSILSKEVGIKLEFSEDELFDLEIAGLLHDVGTLGIPESIKQASFEKLTPEEVALVRQQTVFAKNLLSSAEEFERAGQLILSHLERLDGSGFPDGLLEEHIPLGSQVIGVVNAFDEIKNRRRFSGEAISLEKAKEDFALKKIKKYAGKHYKSSIITTLEEVVIDLRERKRGETYMHLLEVEPGMMLAAHVYLREGQLLLAKGTRLSAAHIEKLKTFNRVNLLKDYIRVNAQ